MAISCSLNKDAWIQQHRGEGNMEKLKQLLFCASLELEQAQANVETQRQLQEARLLHLEELLTATLRERDEARDQLRKLEAEYSNMVTTNTQQHAVMMSTDHQSQWPDDQFCRNSTPDHQFDLPPDFDCSRLTELQDRSLYNHHQQQLNFVEQYESEQQQQEVESHFLASPHSILVCAPEAMPAHLPEPPAEAESALPERGKLLQAIMQAGPLLQNLLMTGPLPEWRNPPPALDSLDSLEIPKIPMCFSSNSLPLGPLTYHVSDPHGPTDALDPLHLNSAVSSSHHRLRPRTIINEPPTGSFITSLQSGSAAASSSSKLSFAPVLNSLNSSITASRPLKFAKRRVKKMTSHFFVYSPSTMNRFS